MVGGHHFRRAFPFVSHRDDSQGKGQATGPEARDDAFASRDMFVTILRGIEGNNGSGYGYFKLDK
jgi:hypothetical protein